MAGIAKRVKREVKEDRVAGRGDRPHLLVYISAFIILVGAEFNAEID